MYLNLNLMSIFFNYPTVQCTVRLIGLQEMGLMMIQKLPIVIQINLLTFYNSYKF